MVVEVLRLLHRQFEETNAAPEHIVSTVSLVTPRQHHKPACHRRGSGALRR
jgi:hypothetical protein